MNLPMMECREQTDRQKETNMNANTEFHDTSHQEQTNFEVPIEQTEEIIYCL